MNAFRGALTGPLLLTAVLAAAVAAPSATSRDGTLGDRKEGPGARQERPAVVLVQEIARPLDATRLDPRSSHSP